MKNTILIILALAVIILLVLQFKSNHNIDKESSTKIDTVYVNQTIKDTVPKLILKTIKETVIDTLYNVDSILTPILIPVELMTYQNELITDKEDTIRYKAYIEGYKAKLDSINIAIKYKQFNTTTIIDKKQSWKDKFILSPSIGVGYGLFNRNFDVYLGFSIGYKF